MIRWITPTLGTAPATNVSNDEGLAVVDVRDLVDKAGNPAALTREKIDRAVALLRSGCRVVVCCDYGISRSNAIAAGILSQSADMPFNQALGEVIRHTGETEIKLELLDAVRQALGLDAVTEPPGSLTPRILVTGGGGLIGKSVVRLFSERHFVSAPSHAHLDLLRGSLELDLLVKERQVNWIVHLANPAVSASNAAMSSTMTMLRNVLDVCRANRARLAYASGWEVFSGYRSRELLADEALLPNPRGPSAEAKYLCECLLAMHARQYGLEYALLRSGTVYGEGASRPRFIRTFIEKARSGAEIRTHRYRNGAPALDLVNVEDAARALLAVVEAGYTGTLHIGTGRVVETQQIAELIVAAVGSASRITSVAIEDFTANVAMNSSLARKVLGWHPEVEIEEGIRRLVEHELGLEPR